MPGRARVPCVLPRGTRFVQHIILYYWLAAVRQSRHRAEELYLEVLSGLEAAQSSWKEFPVQFGQVLDNGSTSPKSGVWFF